MAQAVILGCGYVGQVLAKLLLAQGHRVRATTTTPGKLEALAQLGTEPFLLDPLGDHRAALLDAELVFHLGPPRRDEAPDAQVQRILKGLSDRLSSFIYGSTTGVFGQQPADVWVDEARAPGPLGARGEARAKTEAALIRGLDPKVLRVVRIAGIYGPGRTLERAFARPGFLLFESGPDTSRIHVDDLARLLLSMAKPTAPKLVIGCDELPAPTLDVARYTCELLGRPMPPVVTLAQAKSQLSEAALEMRMSGRRCRSLHRRAVMGALRYPTFKEGVLASLQAEKV